MDIGFLVDYSKNLMNKLAVEYVPVRRHKLPRSEIFCSSLTASFNEGQVLICICCGSDLISPTHSTLESVVEAIAREPIPKTIFVKPTPK